MSTLRYNICTTLVRVKVGLLGRWLFFFISLFFLLSFSLSFPSEINTKQQNIYNYTLTRTYTLKKKITSWAHGMLRNGNMNSMMKVVCTLRSVSHALSRRAPSLFVFLGNSQSLNSFKFCFYFQFLITILFVLPGWIFFWLFSSWIWVNSFKAYELELLLFGFLRFIVTWDKSSGNRILRGS